MTAPDRPPAERLLPPGRQVTVTWSIPERYGGMTAALLRRARSFVRVGGSAVDILTLDPRLDLPRARRMLGDRGELVEQITLRHLYDDVRRLGIPGAPPATVEPTLEAARTADEIRTGDAAFAVWEAEGHTIRFEHRRADGTLALLDERRRADGPRRLLTAFDTSGAATGQWTDAWSLYASWLDGLLGDDAAFVIADSKTVAPFVQSYRRAAVTTIHAVHGAHLRHSGARLDAARKPVLENLHLWDAVVFLTERQRDNVIELMGDSGNLAVVPNGIDDPPPPTAGERDPTHGVIVANLTVRKRLHHALEIIAAARAAGAPVTAEIIGDGPERAHLEQRAARLGLDSAVVFGGYRAGAAARFADASWTLITSRSEGAPLVILEAMARGCIPVAYDIRYGPADMIDPGENGFLVRDGDRDAAAAALVHLSRIDAEALRERALATARAHSDSAVVALWAQVQRDADQRRRLRAAASPAITRARVRQLRGRIRITAVIEGATRGARVRAELFAPHHIAPVRVPLRRVGRVVFGHLDRARTAELGRRSMRVRFVVDTADVSIALEVGRRRPDPRTLARRAAQRLRRALRR